MLHLNSNQMVLNIINFGLFFFIFIFFFFCFGFFCIFANLILQLLILRPKFKVFGPEIGDLCLLLLNFIVFIDDYLNEN